MPNVAKRSKCLSALIFHCMHNQGLNLDETRNFQHFYTISAHIIPTVSDGKIYFFSHFISDFLSVILSGVPFGALTAEVQLKKCRSWQLKLLHLVTIYDSIFHASLKFLTASILYMNEIFFLNQALLVIFHLSNVIESLKWYKYIIQVWDECKIQSSCWPAVPDVCYLLPT